MEKLDLTKKYKSYYTAKTKPEVVEIGEVRFISITGKGDPSSHEFAANIEALYSVGYSIKFLYKARDKDFVVAKLEGLWSFDEIKYGKLSIDEAPRQIPRSEWEYRLLIRIPDFVQESDIVAAIKQSIEKKDIIVAKNVKFYTMKEGKSVQMMHVGAYSTEPDSLRQIGEYMQSNNLVKSGLHHEIYLSDFRKTVPDKLKTILREPVKEGK